MNDKKQNKIDELISYEEDLIRIWKDREATLNQLDVFSIEELNEILSDVYNQKINTKQTLDQVKNKITRYLKDDITYNKMWANETRKKITKLSDK